MAELHKRLGDGSQASKQAALNIVFEKAIRIIDAKAKQSDDMDGVQSIQLGTLTTLANQGSTPNLSRDSTIRPDSLFSTVSLVPVVPSARDLLGNSRPPSLSDLSFSGPQVKVEHQSAYSAVVPPPQTKVGHRTKWSTASEGQSSVHSEAHSVRSGASTGTRQSTRSKGGRKPIIESDDENGRTSRRKPNARGRSRDVDGDDYDDQDASID